MNKTLILTLLAFLSLNSGMQAQETEEKSFMRKFIEENNIPKVKYKKIWDLLERNYISYHPDEKWEVLSDTLAYVFDNDSCYMQNNIAMHHGVLNHKDGRCRVAILCAYDLMDDRRLPIPRKLETEKGYIFSYVAAKFKYGKRYRSRTKQELKDAEMLVTYYPPESAKSIFNGVSMFIYPLDFKGEYCEAKYRYGRGVVVLGKYNVPFYLSFFMTDESIVDFDKYLSELKGVFTFRDLDEYNQDK